MDGFLFVGSTQVFTYGEDSYALPLTSELDALCGENVNRILLRQRLAEHSSNRMDRQRKEKRHPERDTEPPRYSPMVKILTPCRLQASLTRSAARM